MKTDYKEYCVVSNNQQKMKYDHFCLENMVVNYTKESYKM